MVKKQWNKYHFCIILVQSANGIILDHFQVDFVSNQIANIVDSILDHRGSKMNVISSLDRKKKRLNMNLPFQRQSPSNHIHVLRQTHGQ